MKSYSKQELVNFQDMGWEKTLQEANKAIAKARKATPPELHSEYTSWIRYQAGGYSWSWIL